jgi:SAM-dependent methyltransferase
MYGIASHIAEVYDQVETQTDDVELIRRLMGGRGPLRVLEPFCGTGRILIPLAVDGHRLVGLDQAQAMLDRARAKIKQLATDVQQRITLVQADVTASAWPDGFDVVILGANCFYELATPEEQEGCIASAAAALEPGGHVYVDNDHMEGELDEGWQRPGITKGFPTGTCADGARVEGAGETIWFDARARLVRFRRSVTITLPDGATRSREWIQQKHPVSAGEVTSWLGKHGFAVERMFGDRQANPYTEASPRAIFWARKREGRI